MFGRRWRVGCRIVGQYVRSVSSHIFFLLSSQYSSPVVLLDFIATVAIIVKLVECEGSLDGGVDGVWRLAK